MEVAPSPSQQSGGMFRRQSTGSMGVMKRDASDGALIEARRGGGSRPGSPAGDCAKLVRLLTSTMHREDLEDPLPKGSGRLHRPASTGYLRDQDGKKSRESPKNTTSRLVPLPLRAEEDDNPFCMDPEDRARAATSPKACGKLQRISTASTWRSGVEDSDGCPGEGRAGQSVRLSPLPVIGMPEDHSCMSTADRKRTPPNGLRARQPSAGRARPDEPESPAIGDNLGQARRRVQSTSRLHALSRSGSSPQLLHPYTDDFLRGSVAGCARGPVRQLRRNKSGACDGSPAGTSLSEASTAANSPSAAPLCPAEGAIEQDESLQNAEDDSHASSLLQRRRLSHLAVQTQRASGVSLSSAILAAVQSPKEIASLEVDQKIFDLYHWDEVLQEQGDGGKVVVCQPKTPQKTPTSPAPSQTYVMKIRSKESLDRDCMGDQFRKALLRMLNIPPHIGVLPIHEVLEDDRFYYIVMEKASGGSFFSSLLLEFGDGVMPANAVRKVMREILEAVGHVHQQGILHRDIKPDNLVWQAVNDEQSPTGKVNRVALIDFDHAEPDWKPDNKKDTWQSSWCGTIRFSAPETFAGSYSQASDLYSIGVILYMLLAGSMPYDDVLFQEVLDRRDSSPKSGRYNWKAVIFQRMKESPISWSGEQWIEQPLCRDFCQRLLAFSPEQRPASSREALNHPWFTSETEGEATE